MEALLRLARNLPGDMPAAVFAVIHTSPDSNGELPGLIHRAGPLPCEPAEHGQEIRRGRIHLAPPDRHLLIEPGRILVVRGPKENCHRPAIDPLFRSASLAYGPRVIGVILSGNLDDGALGLDLVRKGGGLAVVQDPRDALFSGMPRNALDMAGSDHVLPLKEIPELLSRLCREDAEPAMEPEKKGRDDGQGRIDAVEAGIFANRLAGEEQMRAMADPSVFTCPDCGGTLFERRDDGMLRFRCSTGHGLTGLTLLAAQAERVESALAASFRTLVEAERLYRRLSQDLARRNMPVTFSEMKKKADEARDHARIIQDLLAAMGAGGGKPGAGAGEAVEKS